VPSKRILLVDDEPSIRFVLGAVLEQSGYTVDSAEDGFAALRKLRTAMPDLVITDLRMPNMNGFELLSVLRTRFPQLPTIAISGEFLRAANESPIADAFFQKGNYPIDGLLDTVSRLLSTVREKHTIEKSSVWAPTGDAPLMLTCTSCLRSFPIDPCDGGAPPKEVDCILCGAHLNVQLVAVGVAPSA
jgi:CheY-like chemotaxis protein